MFSRVRSLPAEYEQQEETPRNSVAIGQFSVLKEKLELWRRRQLRRKLEDLEARHTKEQQQAAERLEAQMRHSVAKKLQVLELEQQLQQAYDRCQELEAMLQANGMDVDTQGVNYSQAGGLQHDGNVFEDDTFLKKAQTHQMGCFERENEFLMEAMNHPFLKTFVPNFHCAVLRDNVLYSKMQNVQHGFKSAAQLDIRMGTRTYRSEMSYSYKMKKRLLDSLTTTPALGVALAGGNVRGKGGLLERVGSCYTTCASASAFQAVLEKFLLIREGNFHLVNALQEKLLALYHWFRGQSEWSFTSSSLLLLYDNSETTPTELRVFLIDFAHTYCDGAKEDCGYLTGIETLLHMVGLESECLHLTGSKVHDSDSGTWLGAIADLLHN